MSIEVVNGTCQIVGQPTESKPETAYTVTAKAADGSSDTATATISVRVGIPPVLESVIAPVTYVASVPIAPEDVSNTGDGVVSCSIPPNLPNGLSIVVHNASCRISGTATESRGATDYTITATALDGSQDSTTINITVDASNPRRLQIRALKLLLRL